MKKLFVFLMAVTAVLLLSGQVSAFSWTFSKADVYAAGGVDVALPGSVGDLVSSIPDPFGGVVTPDGVLAHQFNTGYGFNWTTATECLVTMKGVTQLRLDFSAPVSGWGMYLANSQQDWHSGFVVTLSSGESVNYDPRFGGFFGILDADIDWIDINYWGDSGPDTHFGFGEMVMVGPSDPAIPEPTTIILIGLGLAGLGTVRKK
ncbi:MAG: PEP-CTERM sorting domain-containing protein [FCB group bacterium]|nr:PEP-CTERM sorting domain-containing protein [FCB group bacterium]